MARNNKSNLETVYKWVTIIVAIFSTGIFCTIATISYLKETVKEGVTDGIAVLVEDVKNLKEHDALQDKQLADLKTVVDGHSAVINILKADFKRSSTDKVAIHYIDNIFNKPEELVLQTKKKKIVEPS